MTADGDVLTVTDQEYGDLFWGIRGGGGNFGVATALQYRAHYVPDVLGGLIAHPLEHAVPVIERYHDVTATAPDELTAFLGLLHAPDGSGMKLIGTALCHCGDAQQAERDVGAFRGTPTSAVDTVARLPYPAMNTMLDDAFPPGTLNYWKSAFLKDLSTDSVGVLVDAFVRCPSTMTSIVIAHYHGATSRVAPTATAMPHRGPGYSCVILTEWTDPADTNANLSWTQETFETLHPHTTDRVYVNNLSNDDTGAVPSAYGVNWDRLVEVKRRYDPDNIFRLNHNIDPSAHRADAAVFAPVTR